jgi:hypothetical protein
MGVYDLDTILYLNTGNFYLSYHGVPSKEIFVLKAKLITDLTNIFGLNPQSATETFNEQFNGFIDFYISVAENISYNIYFELIKLLSSMKKISLLLEIVKILMDKA